MASLIGSAIVVTGAGRGLGRAYARAVAEAGASVVVNDIDGDHALAVVDEIIGAGGSALSSAHDIADAAGAEALVGSCVDRFGRIDGLVNNAGLFHVCPAWDEDPMRMRHLVEANVLGSMNCGIAALRRMREAGSGSIVNVTSGAHLGIPGMSTYGASKGAITALTVGWALDLRGTAIRVNAVSPIARTRMADAVDDADRREVSPPPEVIAPLVVYLLGPDSMTLTGQVIRLDGDRLGVLAPGRYVGGIESPEPWSAETIAAAFASGDLRPQPIGLDRRERS